MLSLRLPLLLATLVALAAAQASTDADATSTGVSYAWHPNRMVGGAPAAPHSAPWIVTLQWGLQTPSQHCGGSILTPAWVLTAAHCLGGITNIGQFVLIAGRHNIRQPEPRTEQRRTVNRARTFSHPDYTSGLQVGPFDIGLIHVAPAFTFNAYVRAVQLPAAGAIPSGLARLHGWGSIVPGTPPVVPEVLHTVQKPVLPLAQCVAALAGGPVHVTNVCTGPLTGGVSACSGDSGGPLTQGAVQIGVVSWGVTPCGTAGAPSVYVRVSAFIDWIQATMRR